MGFSLLLRRCSRSIWRIITAVLVVHAYSVTPALAEPLSLRGFWNGFLAQQNSVECSNLESHPVDLQLNIMSNSGISLHERRLLIPSHGTLNTNISELLDLREQYGTYLVTEAEASRNSRVICHTVVKRLPDQPRGKPVDYAYSLPTDRALRGTTSGIFNSMHPDGANQPVANWLSIANLSNAELTGQIERYSLVGELLESSPIPPLVPGRRTDIPLGHDQGQVVGLYRFIPNNATLDYSAFITRYAIDTRGKYIFAFPLLAANGSCDAPPVPASTMDPALNWGEVANAGNTPLPISVDIRNRDGQVIHQENFILPPFSQRHIPIHLYLGERTVGSFHARCISDTSGNALLVQSLFYGRLTSDSGSTEWAYASQMATESAAYGQMIAFPVNRAMETANWIKFHEGGAAAVILASQLFDQSGFRLIEQPHDVARGGSIDVGVHEMLGESNLGLLLSRVGEGPSRIASEQLRVFGHSAGNIGSIMKILPQIIPASVVTDDTGNGVSLSGLVADGNTGLADVIVDALPLGLTISDANGRFVVGPFPRGTSLQISFRKPGFRFEPAARTLTLTDSTQLNVAAFSTATVSGRIRLNSGSAAANIRVVASGTAIGSPSQVLQTDANGQFQLNALPIGSQLSLVPESSLYSFTPPRLDLTVRDNASFEFGATQTAYELGGIVLLNGQALSGVTVTEPQLGTRISDINGAFSFGNVPAGTAYSIAVSRSGYAFTPSSISGTVQAPRILAFSAQLQSYSLSGRVTDAGSGTPIEGVAIDGGPLGSRITNSSGNYTFADIPFGTPYTLTPVLTGRVFSPPTATGTVQAASVVNFGASLAGQDLAIDLRQPLGSLALINLANSSNLQSSSAGVSGGSARLVGVPLSSEALNPTLAWRFDSDPANTSWLVVDDSPNQIRGNIQSALNSPIFTADSPFPGGALQFTKNPRRWVYASTLDLPAETYTLSFWAKGAPTNRADTEVIVGAFPLQGEINREGNRLKVLSLANSTGSPGRTLVFRVGSIDLTIGAESGGWQHLAVTYDGTVARTFLNGVLTNSRSLSVSQATISLDYFSIGNDSLPNSPYYGYEGTVDDVLVFPGALSESTIRRTYLSGSGSYGLLQSIDSISTGAAVFDIAPLLTGTNTDHVLVQVSLDNGVTWCHTASGRGLPPGCVKNVILSYRFRLLIPTSATVTGVQFSYGRQTPQCADGIDNDGDTLIDAAANLNDFDHDSGCDSPADPTERNGYGELSVDSSGWSVLPTVSGPRQSRNVYVSSVTGNDAYDGLSPDPTGSGSGPKRTVLAGYALLRDLHADRLLLRRGEVFDLDSNLDWGVTWTKSGESPEFPIALASYGAAPTRPELRIIRPGAGAIYFYAPHKKVRNVAIVGVRISPVEAGLGQCLNVTSATEKLLLEDVYIEKCSFLIEAAGREQVPIRDFSIRRSVLADAYQRGGARSSGLHTSFTVGTTLEESLLDHNGWSADIDVGGDYGGNHNWYSGAIEGGMDRRMMAVRNVFSRASFLGASLNGDSQVIDNLFVLNPVGLGFSTFGVASGNVITEGTAAPYGGVPIAKGVQVLQAIERPLVLRNNLIVHSQLSQPVGMSLYGNLSNQTLNIRENILYNHGPLHFEGRNITGATIANNIVQIVNTNSFALQFTSGADPSLTRSGGPTMSFTNNTYFRLSANTPQSLVEWYTVPNPTGSIFATFAQWQQHAEPTAVLTQRVFADPNRRVSGYATLVGAGSSSEQLLNSLRSQSRNNWDSRLATSQIIAFMRAGFAAP